MLQTIGQTENHRREVVGCPLHFFVSDVVSEPVTETPVGWSDVVQ